MQSARGMKRKFNIDILAAPKFASSARGLRALAVDEMS